MASPSQLHSALTLEEFLRLPEIDEHPYLEFIDGRIEAKVSPQKKHSLITMGLIRCIDDYSLPRRLGRCFVELRCTFGGRSIIPDIVFLIPEHVLVDENGDAINETLLAPDIHIEIISPDQSPQKAREKLRFSTSHGCPLGWLIDPERRTIDVYEGGVPPERLPDDGCLDGGLLIPNFRLSIAEVFQWMRPFVEAKPSPQKKHSVIQKRLMMSLDSFSQPRGLGETFPELRCSFAGRSLVPDVVFLTTDHIQADSQGDLINETFQPPDIHVEIASPDQPAKRNRDSLQFSTANGCLLGWLIDPERKTVEIFGSGGSRERLTKDGVLEGAPVLPGYRLPLTELFDWLKVRRIKPSGSDTPDPGTPSS